MKELIDNLEKQIKGKMMAIKTGQISPAESGIGKLFKHLKTKDLPLYEKLLKEYKEQSNK